MKGIEWTTEMLEMLESQLGLEEAPTYRIVAERMSKAFGVSFSKNACIGMARRLRMPPRPPRPEPVSKPAIRKIKVDAPIEPPLPRCRKPDGVTIYQLREGVCKWPYGAVEDRPPFRYCGKQTEFGDSFCPEHFTIAYNTPRRMWG